MKGIGKLILAMFFAFILASCSEAKETTKQPVDNKSEQTKIEEKKVEQIELPNVIDEIIGWEWEPFHEKWGKTQEVQVESGNGYELEKIPDVTIIPNDNGIISSVIIYNKNMDVYGSKVGQTPTDVKKVMDDYGFEMISEGEDEMDGGWLVQYQIDENKMAWYTSDGEDKPVKSILITVVEMEQQETQSEVAGNPIRVNAQITDVSQDLIGQLVCHLQVTNFESETVINGKVKVSIEYVVGGRYDFPLTWNETLEFNNVQSGETKEYNISIPADDINGLKNVEATGE
jgi:hypothetical protein